MPTEAKRQAVAELAERIGRATMAVATDISGLTVNETTDLRRRLREQAVEYRVVKNRLAALAAHEAGVEAFAELLEGSTGIAFGYDDPLTVAKALDGYVKATRSRMVVRKGLMDGVIISGAQIATLASLPSKVELLARLLGQLNAPISRLATVLNGPVRGLAIVLQRRSEQLASAS